MQVLEALVSLFSILLAADETMRLMPNVCVSSLAAHRDSRMVYLKAPRRHRQEGERSARGT
jgi:hypothetical protein